MPKRDDSGTAPVAAVTAPLRVCLISPMPPPYGGITNWTMIVHRSSSTCSDVQFLQLDTAVRWRALHDVAIWKRLLGGSIQGLRDYAAFVTRLFKRPDVVHLTTSGGLGAVRDLLITGTARLCRIPVVYHIRFGRVPAIAASRTLEWRLLAQVIRMASAVVAITPATLETIAHSLPAARVEYVPNPVDCSQLPPPASGDGDRRCALYLGCIVPGKGVEELVRAWARLGSTGWEMLLAGSGDPAYEQDLARRFAPRNLRFLGELPHEKAMELMAHCDLFILPSHTEGFPNVILEAMALGKAIIATTVGAIPDMLAGGCGLLIEPRDVDGLKGALRRLMQDDRLRSEYGRRARDKAWREYAADAVFARYCGIWRSVANGDQFSVQAIQSKPGVLIPCSAPDASRSE